MGMGNWTDKKADLGNLLLAGRQSFPALPYRTYPDGTKTLGIRALIADGFAQG